MSNLNKIKKNYPFGNYPDYYSYRKNLDAIDDRLVIISKELMNAGYKEDLMDIISGKSCLDIGCNSGRFTIDVAVHYRPSWIVGADIDGELVRKARHSIYLTASRLNADMDIPHDSNGCINYFDQRIDTFEACSFPRNIRIMQSDYAKSLDNAIPHQFDVIFCMSVTKWIHLNGGDPAVKLLFQKIFLQLRTGGYLILEPQSFNTYRKRRKLTKVLGY